VVVVAGEPHVVGTTSAVTVMPIRVTVGPPTVAAEALMLAVEAVEVVEPRFQCATTSQWGPQLQV
jgi:hypothetical protein